MGGLGLDIIYIDHDDIWTYCDVEVDDDEAGNASSFILKCIEEMEPQGKVFLDWDAMKVDASEWTEDCDDSDFPFTD